MNVKYYGISRSARGLTATFGYVSVFVETHQSRASSQKYDDNRLEIRERNYRLPQKERKSKE